jgi:hypothetical protein
LIARDNPCARAELLVGGLRPRRNVDGVAIVRVVEEAITTEIAMAWIGKNAGNIGAGAPTVSQGAMPIQLK